MDFGRAVGLMRGRHTKDMHDRHVVTLQKICQLNKGGFFLSDVESVATLLALSRANLQAGAEEYAGPLCELMQVVSCPFLKQRCNDDERFEKSILHLLAELGSLVECVHSTVSVAAVEVFSP